MSSLQYTFKSTQQQRGSIICGLFALARAYDFASGIKNLSNVYYYQPEMRQHFINCLLSGNISRFPLLHPGSTVRLSQESRFQIPLLSCCYLPITFSREGTFNCSKNGCNKINHRICNDLDRNSSNETINNSICYDCHIENDMKQMQIDIINESQMDEDWDLVVP
eukprot:265265_1